MSLCSEYQIGRRKYPIVNMSESNSKELERRKNLRVLDCYFWLLV